MDEISQSASKYKHYAALPKKEGKRAASSGVILLASPSKKQKEGTVVRTAHPGERRPEYQVVVQKK